MQYRCRSKARVHAQRASGACSKIVGACGLVWHRTRVNLAAASLRPLQPSPALSVQGCGFQGRPPGAKERSSSWPEPVPLPEGECATCKGCPDAPITSALGHNSRFVQLDPSLGWCAVPLKCSMGPARSGYSSTCITPHSHFRSLWTFQRPRVICTFESRCAACAPSRWSPGAFHHRKTQINSKQNTTRQLFCIESDQSQCHQ